MQIGRKSIKKQTRRQSGEMKGGSEGWRMEFSTSVTLAGLSIMCDVVEAEKMARERPCRLSPSPAHVFFNHGYKTGQDIFICSKAAQQKHTMKMSVRGY